MLIFNTEVSMLEDKRRAFTLAELLTSLTIIGVIAVLTVPVVMNVSYNKVNEAGLKKAIIALDEALDLSRLDSTYQPYPRCFYWSKRPSWMCASSNPEYNGKSKTVQNSNGTLSWYCADGSSLPANWNGDMTQCTSLVDWLANNMRTIKKCTSNGYDNGCMPLYKGNDEVYVDNNAGKTMSDAFTATYGCGGWNKSNMKSKFSWVTSDGMIFFPYNKGWPGAAIIAVDVNGKKKPNKWGYDVFTLQLIGDGSVMFSYGPGGCEFIEKGGKSVSSILKGK